MIKAVKDNFPNDATIKVIEHDLDIPLLDIGYFAVISCFTIHHLTHKRKMLFMKKFTICFILPVSFVIWIMDHHLQWNNIKKSSKLSVMPIKQKTASIGYYL
jgi:hypothetical protein